MTDIFAQHCAVFFSVFAFFTNSVFILPLLALFIRSLLFNGSNNN